MDQNIPTPAENRQAGEQIAHMSPEAAGLLVQFMDSNARHNEWLNNTIQSSLERECDEWKERALDAEARLARITDRLFSILD